MPRLRFALFAAAVVAAPAAVMAQSAPPPLEVNLVLNSSRYVLGDPNDPVRAELTIRNVSCATTGCRPLFTTEGFSVRPFHLFLVFVGPDGKPITAPEAGAREGEGGPPRVLLVNGTTVQVDPLERLDPDFTLVRSLPDARAFYPLGRPGRYSVKAVIAFRSYPGVEHVDAGVEFAELAHADFAGVLESPALSFALIGDADGDGYAFPEPDPRVSPSATVDCDDARAEVNPGATEVQGNGVDDDCNPETSDAVVAPAGELEITAARHTVGTGARPGSIREPAVGLPVRIFDTSPGSCATRLGTSWREYRGVWLSCMPVSGGIAATAADGSLRFRLSPGTYLAIGEYRSGTGEAVYAGTNVGEMVAGSVVHKRLDLIARADGKILPARYTVRTGSELVIIEPEFIEWTGAQELYPFIFESVGDWTVTTSVQPPEGFVADYASLAAQVNSSREVVQFTITDVGSDWVPTEVRYRITHRGRSEVLRSRIGVRLAPGLARAKGVTPFGQPLSKPAPAADRGR